MILGTQRFFPRGRRLAAPAQPPHGPPHGARTAPARGQHRPARSPHVVQLVSATYYLPHPPRQPRRSHTGAAENDMDATLVS